MGVRPSLSLRSRVLLLAGLNLVLLIALAVAATGVRSQQTLREFLLRTAEARAIDVSGLLSVEMAATPRSGLDALLDQYSSTYEATFALFRNDGRQEAGPRLVLPARLDRLFETARRAARGLPPQATQPVPPRTPFLIVDERTSGYWLGVRIPIRTTSSAETIPGTLVVYSPAFFSSALLFQPGPWLAWGAAALALTMICWVPFLRGLTRRIARMEHATARIADGRFATALDTRPDDELGRLAASIASMATRLGAQVAGQKRFLGDTAHELRSPLARMQVALALLDRDPGTDRAYLQGLQDDVAEMVRLIDDLLRLAREEQQAQVLDASPSNLAIAVQRALHLECRTGHQVRVDVPPSLDVLMDPEALFRAVANVLRNAVRYAGDAGPISVTARATGEVVTLQVADQGPGVPPEALSRLFEPFFRVDPARDRDTGGVGQGLAIVRSAVQACGGTATCANIDPHGLAVRLTLPRARQQADRFASAPAQAPPSTPAHQRI